MPEIGEVEIELGGRKEILRPTLRAARSINALGGFIEAFRKLAAMDLDAYCHIVAAGLGKKVGEVEQDVFTAGVVNLTSALSDFVGIVSNGGKPHSDDDKKKDDTPPGES